MSIQQILVELRCFPDSSVAKESACNAEDSGSIPGSGRATGEGIGYPLQYSWVSLMAQLVKNLPAMRGPGFDPWVGKIPWRRERLPTPVFWPGEFHGLHRPWGCKELDRTEFLEQNNLHNVRYIMFFIMRILGLLVILQMNEKTSVHLARN